MSAARFVDFHCHLDLYPNHAAAVADCEEARVFTLAVTTTPKAWPRNHQLASTTRYVRAALGLHPQLIAERAHEFPLWEELLPQARYVGEVGLDAGPRFYRSLGLQKQVFESVLKSCSRSGGKILTVHSVRAANTVLDLIEAHLPPTHGQVVLHWFTGTKSEARRAVDLGCYFSINAEMLRHKRHRGTVASLPLDRLLTETDGPFTRVAQRSSTPRDVAFVVEELAQLRETDAMTISTAIFSNLQRLIAPGAHSQS